MTKSKNHYLCRWDLHCILADHRIPHHIRRGGRVLDPGYYEKEYTKYHVLNDLPEMTMDDLLDVTDQMMAFLRGKREDLHVYTTMGGEYREFFNDREIAHMEDVQGLFIGGLWLRRIGIAVTAVFAALAYLWGRKTQSGPERSNG